MSPSSRLDPGFLLEVLRGNDELIIAVALAVFPALVLTVVGFMMRCSGVSARPIFFIGGMIGTIAAGFLVSALVHARLPGAPDAASAGLSVREGRFVEREKLFGPDVPAHLIREAKTGLPGILDEAEAAEAAATMTGETTLIAQFPADRQAKEAAAAYHRGFQLRDVGGDEKNGWQARRGPHGDFVEMLRRGRLLFVWSGLSKEASAARRAMVDVSALLPFVEESEPPPLFPELRPIGAFFESTESKVIALSSLTLLMIVYFFKGASWAGSVPASGNAQPVAAAELAARLRAINQLDVPLSIAPGSGPHEFLADWRYADAKWADLAGAHGLRRTFRIRLTLDEKSHTVRVTDYIGSLDWSAGRRGVEIEWKAAMGIIFFQSEAQRIRGLRFDDQGRFIPETSHTWRFNLGEMKSPLISAVTQSGWTWRPTLWQGPEWLRWLTE